MSNQRVGALVYGLGADEPTYTSLVTPLILERFHCIIVPSAHSLKNQLVVLPTTALYPIIHTLVSMTLQLLSPFGDKSYKCMGASACQWLDHGDYHMAMQLVGGLEHKYISMWCMDKSTHIGDTYNTRLELLYRFKWSRVPLHLIDLWSWQLDSLELIHVACVV